MTSHIYEPHQNTIANLAEMGLLCVAGTDAKKFLQGQLTCNLDNISSASTVASAPSSLWERASCPRRFMPSMAATSQACFGAQCNPQGRIIHFFKIFHHEDGYYLQMPITVIPIALAALKKYAVFFKVTLSDASETFLFDRPTISVETWKPIHFQNNIPTIYPETSEKFLPHDIGLPQLNAVSFDKGCYTGQEIIARMHYRGKLKYQLFQVTVNTSKPLVRGADIYDGQNPVGMLVDYYKTEYNSYRVQIMVAQTDELFLDANKQYPISR